MRSSAIGSLLAVAVLCLAATRVTAAGEKGRPNILYILTDQQYAGAMSCAGNRDLTTPGMDRLARRGVRFENAYCTQPLCMPSRAAMLTGRYPHEIGATDNRANWHQPPAPLLGAILSAAGYRCGWFGKWHIPISTSRVREHGFSVVALDKGKGNDARIASALVEFVTRSPEGPFFAVGSFMNPHNICEWARGEPAPEGAIPPPPAPELCPSLPDNFEIPFDEPEVVRAVQARHAPGYPTTGWPPDKWRQYRWAYCRLIEKVDVEIAGLLDALDQKGLLGDTAIIFSSDHGDGSGSHRWNQKQVLYEEATKVPFIVSLPGVGGDRVDREHLIDAGLDLYPTICELARVTAPQGLRGLSILSLLEGGQSTWRKNLICETEFASNAGGMGIDGRAVRDDRYKYLCYSEGARREQLFDLLKDPGESLNLIAVPEMAERVRGFRESLSDWCRETGDNFPVPGASP